jgi:hypothetical protein
MSKYKYRYLGTEDAMIPGLGVVAAGSELVSSQELEGVLFEYIGEVQDDPESPSRIVGVQADQAGKVYSEPQAVTEETE